MTVYPDIEDPDFEKKIFSKKEFNDTSIDKRYKKVYSLEPSQRFIRNYISHLTHYNYLLVYHSVGVGKTLTAINVALNMKGKYNTIVITKNKNIEENFKRQMPEDLSVSFISYRGVSGKSIDTGLNYKTGMKNTLFILDEAHNAVNNDAYIVLKDLFNKSKNIKVILLTATPMFDNVREIFEIANLLGANLPIRNEILKEKMAVSFKLPLEYNSRYSDSEKSISITKKGKDALVEALKGKISYLISDEELFPNKKYIDENGIRHSSITYYNCKMNSFQSKIYEDSFKEDSSNVLFKPSSDASTIVYPDGSYRNSVYLKKKDFSFLKFENIKKYSIKIYSILKEIQKSKGPVFIYSNYVSNAGTDILSRALLQNGWTKNSGDKRFVVFDESLGIVRKRKLLKLFNSPENVEGNIIKAIIGSPSVSEGLSFKSVRQIHILEPYWNFSRVFQVIGRGVRFASHSFIKDKKDRIVDIFLYSCSDLDKYKYTISEEKQKSINQIKNMLKRIAVDCELNKSRNLKEGDFKCYPEFDKDSVDKSTYRLLEHDPEKVKYIIDKIKFLYDSEKTSKNFTSKQIYKFVKNDKDIPEITIEETESVLRELIYNGFPIEYSKGYFQIKDNLYNNIFDKLFKPK